MTRPTFQQFETQARQEGFDNVLERRWQAGLELDRHEHPFAAKAMVVQGEMWLTVDDRTQHLLPGDRFELEHGTPHSERYGSEGATYWVARRNRPDSGCAG